MNVSYQGIQTFKLYELFKGNGKFFMNGKFYAGPGFHWGILTALYILIYSILCSIFICAVHIILFKLELPRQTPTKLPHHSRTSPPNPYFNFLPKLHLFKSRHFAQRTRLTTVAYQIFDSKSI